MTVTTFEEDLEEINKYTMKVVRAIYKGLPITVKPATKDNLVRAIVRYRRLQSENQGQGVEGVSKVAADEEGGPEEDLEEAHRAETEVAQQESSGDLDLSYGEHEDEEAGTPDEELSPDDQDEEVISDDQDENVMSDDQDEELMSDENYTGSAMSVDSAPSREPESHRTGDAPLGGRAARVPANNRDMEAMSVDSTPSREPGTLRTGNAPRKGRDDRIAGGPNPATSRWDSGRHEPPPRLDAYLAESVRSRAPSPSVGAWSPQPTARNALVHQRPRSQDQWSSTSDDANPTPSRHEPGRRRPKQADSRGGGGDKTQDFNGNQRLIGHSNEVAPYLREPHQGIYPGISYAASANSNQPTGNTEVQLILAMANQPGGFDIKVERKSGWLPFSKGSETVTLVAHGSGRNGGGDGKKRKDRDDRVDGNRYTNDRPRYGNRERSKRRMNGRGRMAEITHESDVEMMNERDDHHSAGDRYCQSEDGDDEFA
jgi:hypothetical protein